MKKNTLIYLTGFMGCGKSTVGPILANVLGYEFQDMDDEIEKEAGCSVGDLFRVKGEQVFRALEAQKVEESTRLSDYVVALGGGAVVHGDNLPVIMQNGLLVYLRMSPEKLFDRLRKGSSRPLLRDEEGRKSGEEALFQKITTMLEARSPYYERAHVTVDVDDAYIGATIDRIVAELRIRGFTDSD